MWKFFEADRAFIENKYHKTDEPYDPLDRFSYHGYAYDESTGLSDEEIRTGLEVLCSEMEGKPHPFIKACAFRYVLENTRIDIGEHDYFIGIYSWGRLISDCTIEKWHRELFDTILPDAGAFIRTYSETGAVMMDADYEHSVPDWNALFTLGFRGILERSEAVRKRRGFLTEKQEAYYESIRIEYAAILAFIDRLYRYALTRRHAKARRVAECLRHLRDGAPKDTLDVLQLIYLYFMLSESVDRYQVRSLGNGLDAALDPFIRRDLENGADSEELSEYLAYFLMQFAAIGNYWGQPFYLGGTGENGETLVNDASYRIIDVYRRLGIYNPKIQIKVNGNTPEKFLDTVLKMIRGGQNSVVFLCEPGIMKSMMRRGVSYDEARTCDIKGCYEFAVRAGEVSTAPLYLNMLKLISFVFHNGRDTVTGTKLGAETGEAENFSSFEEFYNAYVRQFDHLFDSGAAIVDEFEKYLEYINPSPMFSATITRSVERAEDAYMYGSKYNNTVVLHTGFANAVDSLMAVKYLAFETKTTTLTELKRALDNNWEGYAHLRGLALKCPHKYGNGDRETDALASRLSNYLCERENTRKNTRNGFFKSAMHSARTFITFADATEASPDGRRMGEELSKNASPVTGMDRSGITALLNSAMHLEPWTYAENFAVDVMLHPSAVSGEDGLAAMKAVLWTYMLGGGLAIQFNIFNTEMLYDAQRYPERYKNLQVRVCGWNVLWNNLSREEQAAYILRCENIR